MGLSLMALWYSLEQSLSVKPNIKDKQEGYSDDSNKHYIVSHTTITSV